MVSTYDPHPHRGCTCKNNDADDAEGNVGTPREIP